MIKAIIIDDEQHCIDAIKALLKLFRNEIQLVAYYTSVDDALRDALSEQPDLVFLDVQIHDKTGFDFLRQLNTIPFEVIFTTAHEKFAVQAFKFSAVDYLLKPIDVDDFNLAIEKVSIKIKAKDFTNKVEVLLSNALKTDQNKKITIPTFEGYTFLEVNTIIRCESDVNYTTIFTTSREKIVVSKTLKWFEELLSECNFFRVHNSHLINLNFIEKYSKGKGGYVILNNNDKIEVSTRRKEHFIKTMEQLY
ncbi:MAG: LytTR family DNA-binding domain-containing protein [Flavobacteriaceae bacterium]|nr:response regulator transcription factor [Flavobacteriaceae bacterium]